MADADYWNNLKKYRDEAQAPASQAVLGGVSVFVAESAVPRFVKGDGTIVQERNWATGDRMVDTDGDRTTFSNNASMLNRDPSIPPGGMRKSLAKIRETTFCSDQNDVNDNLYIAPYGSCVFSLSDSDFRNEQNYVGFVDLYINYSADVLGWIETCHIEEGGDCVTVGLQRGVDYRFYRDSKFTVEFLFENDSPVDESINFIYLESFTHALSSVAFTAASLAACAVFLL